MLIVVPTSIFAAFCFAVAAVIQQYRASSEPDSLNLHPNLIVKLAKQPVWLLGIVASIAGFGFQAVALWKGSLTTVQPLLVLGLVFAIPLSKATIYKKLPNVREWLATFLVTGGIVWFLIVAKAKGGNPTASTKDWISTIFIVFLIAIFIIFLSRFQNPAGRSIMQATAAGIVNGLAAAFTKGVAHNVGILFQGKHSYVFIVTHAIFEWQLFALLIDYFLVLLLVQSAFQGIQIGWSLPALTVANPFASLTIGIVAFHESIGLNALSIGLEIIGIVTMLIGMIVLAMLPPNTKA